MKRTAAAIAGALLVLLASTAIPFAGVRLADRRWPHEAMYGAVAIACAAVLLALALLYYAAGDEEDDHHPEGILALIAQQLRNAALSSCPVVRVRVTSRASRGTLYVVAFDDGRPRLEYASDARARPRSYELLIHPEDFALIRVEVDPDGAYSHGYKFPLQDGEPERVWGIPVVGR